MYRGMAVVLGEKVCEELGVVRGCVCIVDEIILDPREPPYDEDEKLEPHVLRRVPVGLVLRAKDKVGPKNATWVRDPELGLGRFFLGRKRRT